MPTEGHAKELHFLDWSGSLCQPHKMYSNNIGTQVFVGISVDYEFRITFSMAKLLSGRSDILQYPASMTVELNALTNVTIFQYIYK